jgi:hypothetical protein
VLSHVSLSIFLILHHLILYRAAGGEHVANESGYYRQFGTNENPIHSKDEAGNIITGLSQVYMTY